MADEQGASAPFVFSFALLLGYSLCIVKKGGNTMITEIAQIEVKPGSEKDFEAAIAKAEPIFKRCNGWKSFELHRSIEKPSRYRLHIKWETLEKSHSGFPRVREFHRMARARRAFLRVAAGSRAHQHDGQLLRFVRRPFKKRAPNLGRLF